MEWNSSKRAGNWTDKVVWMKSEESQPVLLGPNRPNKW